MNYTQNNMDESETYAKWKKLDPKEYILQFCLCDIKK